MGRWEPDARGRLEQAALDLYVERGFDHTTVAEIAERAGLTERTFFRHFADKREVLFSGAAPVTELFVRTVEEAPASDSPIQAVGAALEAVAALIQARGSAAQRRQSVILAHAELRERELQKMASWAEALAEGLRRRGVKEPIAALTAETAIAVFRVAFARWVEQPERRNLPRIVRQSLEQLRAVVA